jgi:Tol biopolymer transport system component
MAEENASSISSKEEGIEPGYLESWKEIAAYLRRDVRTVQRWEKREKLPVRRHIHSKLGTVYAYKAELDAWWRNGHERLRVIEEQELRVADGFETFQNQNDRADGWFRRPSSYVAAGLGVVLLVASVVFLFSLRLARSGSKAVTSRQVRALTTFPGAEMAPAFSPDGKHIVFAWNGPEAKGFNLYSKDLTSQEIRQVTNYSSLALFSAWSPDGRQLAFLRCNDSVGTAFLMPAEGGPETKLFETPCDRDYQWQSISWSSTGELIAYSDRFRGEDSYRIAVFSLKDLQRRVLTTPPLGSQDVFPAFSPDSQAVAFYRCVHADCRIHTVAVHGGEPTAIHSQVEVVDGELGWAHDGKSIIAAIRRENAHQLWRFPVPRGEAELLYSSPADHILHIAVSPDGKGVAFSAVHFDENILRAELPQRGVEMSAPSRLVASSRGEEFPQYSPDGKRIVFQSIRSGTWDVWVCNSEGLNPLQLTQTEKGNSIYPRWSPDGNEIVYDTRRGGHSSVFVVRAEGGMPEHVDTDDMDAEVPSFSPDGRWIYFAGKREKSWQIWKVPRRGGPAVQVTQDGGYIPVVSPDNQWVYYTKGSGTPGIWRVPVQGGTEGLIIPELEARFYADWALVPSGIYFLNVHSKPSPAVEFFDFASGHRASIIAVDSIHSWSDGLAVSPDRHWLLFPRAEKLQSDLMLMDLP